MGLFDPNWPDEDPRRGEYDPGRLNRSLERIERVIDGDLAALTRDSRRFDWRPHPEHRLEAVLWRGNDPVGAFEWTDNRRRRGVGHAFDTHVSCQRGTVNWTRIVIQSAERGGPRLESLGRRLRSRVFRWASRAAYRWLYDSYTRWHWITDLEGGGLISYRVPKGKLRELDGVEMWVSRQILTQPETPFLVVAGWYLLATPFGGFPFVPAMLRRVP